MASNDYGFPVKLGQDVSRHQGRWMWRIELSEPDTMAAAWFTHENLSAIRGTDSHDPAIIGKLVQWRRDGIQECISIAWMEHWPDELGIRPERRSRLHPPAGRHRPPQRSGRRIRETTGRWEAAQSG
jgi:hypothetical protein